jgi:hypothetical protein
MHYHLVTTDNTGSAPGVETVMTSGEAEREALRAAMVWGDWAPKRYPGRTWKRGEVAVYLDRTTNSHQPSVRRELAILRCPANGPDEPNCLLRAMGIPALNLEPGAASEAPEASAGVPGHRVG